MQRAEFKFCLLTMEKTEALFCKENFREPDNTKISGQQADILM